MKMAVRNRTFDLIRYRAADKFSYYIKPLLLLFAVLNIFGTYKTALVAARESVKI